MEQQETNPWKILKTEEKLDTPWVKVLLHDVINPSNQEGIYGVTHFKSFAIGIIPLDEENNTWIVGQYRFPIGAYSWEMPEGGGKKDISPLESAKRELKEETGIEAKDWKMVQTLHLSNSATDEVAYNFIARDLSFGQSEPEPTEDLQVKKIPFDSLVDMVMKGEITDAMTVAAVLKVKHLMMEGSLL